MPGTYKPIELKTRKFLELPLTNQRSDSHKDSVNSTLKNLKPTVKTTEPGEKFLQKSPIKRNLFSPAKKDLPTPTLVDTQKLKINTSPQKSLDTTTTTLTSTASMNFKNISKTGPTTQKLPEVIEKSKTDPTDPTEVKFKSTKVFKTPKSLLSFNINDNKPANNTPLAPKPLLNTQLKVAKPEETLYTQTKTVGLAKPANNVPANTVNNKVTTTVKTSFNMNGKSLEPDVAVKNSVPVCNRYTKNVPMLSSSFKGQPSANKVYATIGTNTEVEKRATPPPRPVK